MYYLPLLFLLPPFTLFLISLYFFLFLISPSPLSHFFLHFSSHCFLFFVFSLPLILIHPPSILPPLSLFFNIPLSVSPLLSLFSQCSLSLFYCFSSLSFYSPSPFYFYFSPLPFFLVFSSDIRETQVLKFEVQNRVNFGCAIGCSAKTRYSGHLFSPFKAVWSLYDLPAPLSPNVKECRKLTEADTMRLFIAAYLCASLSLLYLWHGSPLRAMLHFHKQEAYMVGLWRKWRVDEKKGKEDKRK